MQIAFHIGANCTDEDRLLKSVLKNANALLRQGIAVPGPGKYRRLIRETIQGLAGAAPAPDTRDILLDAIVDNDDIHRIVLSNDNFICVPNRIFENGLFYPQAEAKTRGLHQLFPQDEISLFFGIRNPVTFLQETLSRANAVTISEYLGLMTPEEVRWSDVIARIKRAAPNSELTVWCNEDTPLLWEQLIRVLSGISPDQDVVGGLDMLSTIISDTGMTQLVTQLRTAPPATDAARHELIADIWEKHAIDDKVEDVIELAELDPVLVARMSESYEADLTTIAAMDGVTLILPFS